jgi:hypothetical protein
VNTQLEAFPKTAIDRASEVLVYLEGLLQKRYDSMISASEKHEAMREICDKQRSVIEGMKAGQTMKADADFLRKVGIDPLTGEIKEGGEAS